MTETEDRHASWLELFFDLVVVAAVAQLAHRAHDRRPQVKTLNTVNTSVNRPSETSAKIGYTE